MIQSVSARLLVVPLPPSMRFFGYDVISVPFVEVRDSQGNTGTGFTYTLDAGASVVCAMIDAVVAPAIVGREPEDWPEAHAAVLATTRRLGATAFVAATSAVDIAMWDLRGRMLGAPLYSLLGGSSRATPFYGSGRSGQHLSVDELVASSVGYLADGFDGVKLAIGALPPADDLARVRAVRGAIGDDATLMVDASERLDRAGAVELGRALDDFGLAWFEEPLKAEDVQGYALLADTLRTPIATGEHFQQLQTFERYLAETGIRYYQPDAALGGGVSAMVDVAAAAAASAAPIAWHSLADLHVHLAASTTGSCYVEDFPILDAIIAEPLRPIDGTAVPPDRPGHGILWDDDAIDSFTVAA